MRATIYSGLLFIIVPNWTQSKCPSTGKWINKLVHPRGGEPLSNDKESAIGMSNDRDESKMYYTKRKKQTQKLPYC